MMGERTNYTVLTAVTSLTAIVLATANWLYEPDRALIWGLLIVSLFIGAAAPSILFRTNTKRGAFSRRKIERALCWASLLLAGVLGFALLKETGVLTNNVSKRSAGALIGIVLIVTGNSLPKYITPLSMRACSPARATATERFAGWVFVLGGLVYVAAWVFAPIENAKLWSSLIGLCVFLIVIVAWTRLASGPQQEYFDATLPGDGDADQQRGGRPIMSSPSRGRVAVIILLHALAWAIAMLFASALFENTAWGNQVAPWMSVGFVLANGVLIAAQRKGGRDIKEEGK